jgi:hypothetical protein
VGSAVPGGGFFVIPDIRNAAPAKKMHQTVVEVVEGDASANQIEKEFTQWAGNTCNWRFYAKPMSAKKFLMRFPSAKDIDAWIYFGRTNMRTAQNIAIQVDHWYPGYGAAGELDIAWFQVRGIPLNNRNCHVAVFAGSTIGRTLAVDRHSLNNVDYVRIQIGNLNVALVPSVVPNVNIGASFFDLEFTREIPRGRPQTEPNQVLVEQSDQNRPEGPRNTSIGHTPKRSRIESSGNGGRGGNQSAPGGFMRDVRISYQGAIPIPRQKQPQQTTGTEDSRGKRKAIEPVVRNDSDDDEEYSLAEKTRMLGYGNPVEQTSSSSATRIAPAINHYPMYLEYLARPRITDGVVENEGEPLKNELTYEEFLRKLIESRSDKSYMWKKQLGQLPVGNLEPVVESPVDMSAKSDNPSSQDAAISSESGEALQVHSSGVQITELSPSPTGITLTTVRASVPSIPTPDQPLPMRGSTRIQASGMANMPVLERAVQGAKEIDLEGNSSISSHNSFLVLHDEVIVSKALEIGIDASSIPLETVHMLKDLELARDNLAKKKSAQTSSVLILPLVDCVDNNCEDTNIGESSSHDGSGKEDEDEFTHVLSRKKRMEKRKKKASGKKSNQGVPLCGTKSLKKVSANHPVSDIVSGPRLHNKNVKYK